MKNIVWIVLTLLSISTYGQKSGWSSNDEEKVEEAIATLLEKDPSLDRFFEEAYGYAVFPAIGKGAIGIGGATGRGLVFEQGTNTGTARLSQLSIGFQWGGQSYIEIIFFENQEAMDDFKSNDLKFSAQASVVAIDQGASANAAYEEGVAIFTLAKGGLMYEASVAGQKFKYTEY